MRETGQAVATAACTLGRFRHTLVSKVGKQIRPYRESRSASPREHDGPSVGAAAQQWSSCTGGPCTPRNTSTLMEGTPAYPRENEASVLASLLGKDAARFTDIASSTGLQATQVNRALKALVSQHLVLAQTVPGQDYPIKV